MDEPALLKLFASSVAESGFRVDFALLTHFYVTLKSRPLIILSGPPGSGKSAVVQCLAQILVKGDPRQFQSMIGHAWWAAQAGNVALLTEAQTRLNTGKFMLLTDEAGRPENASQLYIACLNRISPAEVSGFFSEIAFQMRHERLMRLPSYHFTQPIPYPRNLIVIGTMDGVWQNGIGDDFHSTGSVVMWQADAVHGAANTSESVDCVDAQTIFLESRVGDLLLAESRLAALPVNMSSVIQTVKSIADLLLECDLCGHALSPDCALIYLANAWSNDGCGLFARRHEDNLAIALDSLLAREIIQPMIEQIVRSDNLVGGIKAALNGNFPQTRHILDGHNQ